MPPRPGMHPDDLVTPARAAELLGVPPGTVRQWIHRYGITSPGNLGRWPAYDYNDIAAVDARLRREREARDLAA